MDRRNGTPKRVAVFGEDAGLISALTQRLATRDIKVDGFLSLNALTARLRPASGTILVLDTSALPPDWTIAKLVGHIERFSGGRPILVCIAHSSEIDLRLQALRSGAEAFFLKPVPVDELASRLLDLGDLRSIDGCRVLIVDDQPVAAVFAARVLESAGMQTRTVGDALRVLDELEEFLPDLVLMDLNMPGADGIELTTLIREHDDAYDTPVIFLSSELDRGKQMAALRVGGNDFIAKPVRPQRLIEAVRSGIRSRGRRVEQRQAGPEQDRVTGLLKRSAFLRRLDSMIVCGSEPGPGTGVLMIAVDLLDREPEAAESAAIDHLMARLANGLRSSLERGEWATGYGSGRFAILARRSSEDELLGLAQDLGAKLASVDPEHPIRLRVGIGRLDPPADDALTLVSRAEKACSQADEGDGVKVGISRPPVPGGSESERDARLVAMIEAALGSDGFLLVHQPVMAMRGESGEHYETSLRLKASDGEYIPAFDFLPAARRGGLIPALDRWVVEQALDRLAEERDTHRRLRFFVHQSMETLSCRDWLTWLRSQIVARDLIKGPPILQFELADLQSNQDRAFARFGELRRLAIRTCLNLVDEDPQVSDLVDDLGISLVRLPLATSSALEPARLTNLVERMHKVGAKVIVARIEDPQTIARVYGCGVDFIQGNFLQLPAAELCFDFGESAFD